MATLTVDFSSKKALKKVKSSYNMKNYDIVSIKTEEKEGFLDGITSVTAQGSTMTVKVGGKTVKFTNITPDMFIQAVCGEEIYYGGEGNEKTLSDFYFAEQFANQRKWLSKASATKVTGSVFNEDIDVSESYEPTVKNSRKNVGVTIKAGGGDDTVIATDYKDSIYTGDGDDKITAGTSADTITIDGAGDKTIFIKKGDGDDTIVFKGEGLKANVVLAFDYDENNSFDTEYSYRKVGNNLCIDRKWTEDAEVGEITETTTIKDYFKYNPNIYLSKNSSFDESPLTEEFYPLDVSGKESKANTLIGTDYNDVILGGKKADKITTGYGEDTINAGGGNDKITINGAGDKEIYISRSDGNDTIVFDLNKVSVDEKINVKLDTVYNLDEPEVETTYVIAKNQKDLIIKNVYPEYSDYKKVTQTITLQNYFENTSKINLTVNEVDVYKKLYEESDVAATETKGTVFDDELTGTNKADTIYGYAGNDTIIASKGNDKIYGGDGDDRYVYDRFVDELNPTDNHTVLSEQKNLGHDTIIPGGGEDTISLPNMGSMANANFFEPNIIDELNIVYPSYVNNQYFPSAKWFKSGNDLILSGYSDYNSKDTNSITLKDYFKYDKGTYGVKYVDNGEEKYVNYGDWNEQGEWIAKIVRNDNYESINIADSAVLRFDGNYTPKLISWLKPNNFTGTFMNDIIRGNSKPDTLRGGDGNDIIYGMYANGAKKDNLYGDEGNDIIFASDTYAYGGTGNDIFVSDFLDGSDIISDEAGYDRLSLRNRSYLTYFDVTLQGDDGYTVGDDIYIKDITVDAEPIREAYKTTRILDLDENGELQKYDDWENDGDKFDTPKYTYLPEGAEPVDEVVARYVGRPTFEVSDSYYEKLKTNPELLEKFSDYDDVDDNGRVNKRYLDGYALEHYVPKEGYRLVYADWDFYVRDIQYINHGFEPIALDIYDNPVEQGQPKVTKQIYDTNSMYDSEDGLYSTTTENIPLYVVVTDNDGVEHRVPATEIIDEKGNKQLVPLTDESTQEQATYPYVKNLYNPSFNEMELTGIRTILKNAESGVVIKDGTHKETAIETIMLDRDTYDTTSISGKMENLKIGDYNEQNIADTASAVASWLRENEYTSVQDAINKASAKELNKMFKIFENTYQWTKDVKYLTGGYATEGKIEGTAIIQDNISISAPDKGDNSTYELTLKEEKTEDNPNPDKARMSMISDYAGDDKLVLDYNENGYSFLFDVEIDKNGKLQNYSRDFYVKFAGEEGENTGVVICNGRETRHAIENIYMRYEGEDVYSHQDMETGSITENTIFTYNQDTVDEVRQDVAGWLYTNDYASVQDVLHSGNEADIQSMVKVFSVMWEIE